MKVPLLLIVLIFEANSWVKDAPTKETCPCSGFQTHTSYCSPSAGLSTLIT